MKRLIDFFPQGPALLNGWPENLIAALEEGRGRTNGGFTFTRSGEPDDFVSWDQLRTEVLEFAARLRGHGLEAGDRLTLVIAAPRDFVPAFLGTVWAGVIPVPFHAPPSFGKLAPYLASLASALKAIEPTYLLTGGGTIDLIQDKPELIGPLVGLFSVEGLRATVPKYPNQAPAAVTADDIAYLQFTSGSTGSAKAVEVTHAALRSNALAIMRDGLMSESDKDHGVSWLPLTHDMGLVGFVLSPLFNKVSVTFIPTMSFVRNASVWLDTIDRKRATISFAPNFAYALATKRATATQLAKWDLSSLRVLGCGAEPINPATIRAFSEKFAVCGLRSETIVPCYGMAEATLAISFDRADQPVSVDRIQRKAFEQSRQAIPLPEQGSEEVSEFISCGLPLPGNEIAVFDDNDERLGPREVGELWVRGPSLARGYYRDASASAAAFSDGWLRTGDLGYLAEGRVHITGRKKDLIIINGRNYHPEQIEWLLDRHPAVRNGSAVAFSVPGEATEELVVIVEARSEQPEVLQSLLKSHIASELQFTTPTVVVTYPGSLARTASGKRRRSTIRQEYLDGFIGLSAAGSAAPPK